MFKWVFFLKQTNKHNFCDSFLWLQVDLKILSTLIPITFTELLMLYVQHIIHFTAISRMFFLSSLAHSKFTGKKKKKKVCIELFWNSKYYRKKRNWVHFKFSYDCCTFFFHNWKQEVKLNIYIYICIF